MNNTGTVPKGANKLYFIACGNRQVLVFAGSKDKALELSDLPAERSIVRKWDGRQKFYREGSLFKPSDYIANSGGREEVVTDDVFLSEANIAKLRSV